MRRQVISILTVGALLLSSLAVPGRADILYVGHVSGGTIEKFSSTGTDLGTFANSPKPGAAANGLAFDSNGNLYVAYPNITTNLIKYSSTGTFLFSIATGLVYAQGVAVDHAGNVYVGDASANKIEKFSSTGSDLGTFASSGLSAPRGLAFDTAGNLYVVNSGNSTVEKFSPTGTDLGVFAGSPLSGPFALAFDAAGNLYVSNGGSWDIDKFSSTGTFLGVFTHGNIYNGGGMGVPGGLAFDSADNLYVANSNSSIEKFTPTGTDLGHFVVDANSPQFLAFTDDAGNPLLLPPLSAPAIVAIAREGDDIRLAWSTTANKTNFVQATSGGPGGAYSNNFADISVPLIVSGAGKVTTNYLDAGAATNSSSRYYRIRLLP